MAGKEVRAGKAFVEITMRDKLQAGLNRAAARLRAFSAVTSSIGAGLAGASTAILGPLAAAVKQFSDAGDAVHKMAAAHTGLSAEAISELGHAANLSGSNIKTLETGVRRMQQTIGEAATGLGTAKDALAAVGLSVEDLLGLSPEQQLSMIADRIAAIEDPTLRTAAAMDIFGRSGTQLIPMMSGGAAGMQAMRDQAKALGLTISTDTADSAAALTDALGTMWSSIKAVTLNIGAALAPVVTDAAKRLAAVAASVTKFIQKNKQLVVTIAGVGAAIGLAGGALLAIGGTAAVASFALSGLASMIGLIGTVISGIGAAVGALFTPIGLIVAGVAAAAGAWLYFSGVGGEAISWLQTRFGQLVVFVRKVAGGIGDALMAGDLQLAARILWAGVKVAFFRGVEEVASLWPRIKESAQQAWTGVRTATGQAASWLKRTWASLQEAATQLWQSVVGRAREALTAMTRIASDTFGTIRDFVVSMAQSVARRLNMLGTVWQRTAEAAQAAWGGLVSLATGVATAVGSAFARVAGVVRTAFANVWQSLAAGASQVIAFFGRAMSAIGQVGAAIASGFAATFSQVGSTAIETFSGIGRALAAGDFALAAEIAWASIQVAFAQGMAWVTNAWTEFSTGLASIFDGVVTSIRQVWNNISTWIARQILSLVGMVQSLVAKLAAIDPTGLSDKLSAAIDLDVEGTIRILEEDSQRFNQGIGQANAERDDERVRAMQQQLADTERRLAELREARQAALARAGAQGEDGAESPLAGAKAELDRALAEAANATKLFDAGAAQSQLGLPIDAAGMPQLGGSAGLAGTFNAAIAGMLGRSGDDPGERTADAVESMDGKLTDIRDELKTRQPLAFDS